MHLDQLVGTLQNLMNVTTLPNLGHTISYSVRLSANNLVDQLTLCVGCICVCTCRCLVCVRWNMV